MKVIGDDGEAGQPVDFLGADYRIEGPETGVIQSHRRFRHAELERQGLHLSRLIIAAIIAPAAEQQMFDLSTVIQPRGIFHPRAKERFDLPASKAWNGAQNEADVVSRQLFHIIKNARSAGENYPQVDAGRRQKNQQAQAGKSPLIPPEKLQE